MNLAVNKNIKITLVIIIIIQLLWIANKKVYFKFEILKNSFTEDFGAEYVLPKKIIELKNESLKLDLKNISISPKLKENIFFYQRSVEFLYPIKISTENENTFFSTKENIPKTCDIIKKFKYLVLAKC
jgi:hypothetical protein